VLFWREPEVRYRDWICATRQQLRFADWGEFHKLLGVFAGGASASRLNPLKELTSAVGQAKSENRGEIIKRT